MSSWDEVLTENDRRLVARFPDKQALALDEPKALLIIDMNRLIVGENRPILEQLDEHRGVCGTSAWAAMPHITRLVAAAHDAEVPVLFVRPTLWGLRYYGGSFTEGALSDLAPLLEFHPELAIGPGDVRFEKDHPSAFFGTNLAGWLRALGVERLLLAGNTTSGCIRATAVDARAHGFDVAVVEEAVFDRIEVSHRVSLFDLQFKICDVIDVDTACGAIERSVVKRGGVS